ncbi:MAG TPA: histidine phosphatase family protein [Solirubrobacteraceae bacterium]|nr:histidine phosphatase family protein [Solirubrobacteraceae bacterium]
MIGLVRHGQTEWSENGRHTSVTDLALLPAGRQRAAGLAPVLAAEPVDHVLVSPRRRARETAQLAGFGERLEVSEDLAEWHYGDYEGLTTPQIRLLQPAWNLWRDGCPGGESPAQVSERADRVIARLLALEARVLIFAHGHILRALTARWLEAPLDLGDQLVLDPATLSRLGLEHGRRALLSWNARVDLAPAGAGAGAPAAL